MECAEVLKLLPEAALGDLDAGPARRVADHVKACEPCRAAQASLGSTLSALRGAGGVLPSAERREATVRAMVREPAARGSRRGWLRWAAAAGLVVAVAGALLSSDRGFEFRVASVTGRVEVIDRSTGLCRPVAPGEFVRPGDHLVAQPGGIALLDLGAGELHVGPETSLDFISGRKIVLSRGRITAALRGSRDLVLSDTANNTVTLRAGQVEIGLREVRGTVAGAREEKGKTAVLPSPHEEIARRLVARVIEGEADLDGSHRQRLRVSAGQEGTFDFGGQPSPRVPETQ